MYHKHIKEWFDKGHKKLLLFHGMTSSEKCIVCTIVSGLKAKKPIYVATTSDMMKRLKSKMGKRAKIMTHSEIIKRKVPSASIVIVDGILPALKNKKMKELLSHKDRKVVLMGRNHKLLRASERDKALKLLGKGLKRVMYVKKIEPKAFKKVVRKKVKVKNLKQVVDKIEKAKGKSIVHVEKLKDFLVKMSENGYKKYGSRGRSKKYALMDRKGVDAFNKGKVKVIVADMRMKDREMNNVKNIHVIGRVNREIPLDRANRYMKGKRPGILNIIDYKRKRARRNISKKPVQKSKQVKRLKPKEVKKQVNNSSSRLKEQVIVKGKGKKSKKLKSLLDRIQNIPGGPKIELIA